MGYNRLNNLTGWAVCLIACIVYLLTLEPTVSLWDTGEFIASANNIQVPHPPGAPLFILIARFFIILFGDNKETAAIAVNSLSAVASAFTILFLFWTITYFARKLVQVKEQPLNGLQTSTIMSAGAIGALAYTFSDSFWFSAVEGEVYALSSFFTALVFWAILKWERRAHQPGADRWLIFIFFIVGLSIGVHLLSLLTIPAIVMVYYYKRYRVTKRGVVLAFLSGCIVFLLVQNGIIQYTVKGASWFDLIFVNNLGLPFFTGFAFFFVLLTGALLWFIRYANRKKLYTLRVGIWCAIFVMLGYTSYVTTLVRSNADTAVDMFNVDNPVSLQGYLSREQYGDWPTLYGPDFTDQTPWKTTGDLYIKAANKYEVAGKKFSRDWSAAPSAHLFPRMYDEGDERQQADCYRQFSGLEQGETPTMGDNIKYLSRYQVGWMYMRYFMWNFAGKQNDLQGFGNPRDSNFISGFSFVDNTLYGKQETMPDSIRKDNKSHNRLYMLPLALGLAGLFFQFKRDKKNFLVTSLLFFCTGLAIVLFLNQSGYQPRERDYAYVGSFYAFAIWIGLGVLAVQTLLERYVKKPVAAYAAAGLCLVAVPVLMAQQEWDDHDRSHKTLARDLARNYLESCPPNAILFTVEDNDTYPLWYLQDVEGVRPDVRIVITNLLSGDWYINQLRYKINDSAPFDVIFSKEQVAGNRRSVVYHSKLPGFDQEKYYDLYDVLKNVVGSDDPRYTHVTDEGETYNLLPVQKFSLPVDQSVVTGNGTVQPGETVLSDLKIDLTGKNHLFKNDLAMLAIIAANKWKRPICFTNGQTAQSVGLDKYVRLEGLSWRLAPVENSEVNTDLAYKNIMQHFAWGNAGKPGVYFDEENRRRLNLIRMAHVQVAIGLVKAGKKEAAREILQRFDKNVHAANFPYGYTVNRGNQHDIISTQFLQACYLSEDLELAKKVAASLKKDLQQQMVYYRHLGDAGENEEQLVNNAYLLLQGKNAEMSNRQAPFANDIFTSWQMLRQLETWEKEFGTKG